MDSSDAEVVTGREPVWRGRQAWLVLRVTAALVLGLGVSLAGFRRHSVLECLLGCAIVAGATLLPFAKASGFRHRFGAGES